MRTNDHLPRTSARALLVLGFFGSFGSPFISACFIESPKPSTFRFACESDDECADSEECSDGLCQQACGGEDDLDCPDTAPVCFNGHCSSVCPTDEDVCPSPQACLTFADPEATEEPTSGVCAVACNDAHPCAEGELCFEGICLATCTTDEDCGGGTCLSGVCI